MLDRETSGIDAALLKPVLARLASGARLDEAEAEAAFAIVMEGAATPAQIGGLLMALRTRGEPASITPLVRATVTSLDGDLAIYEVDTMRTVIDRQTWFYTIFGTFFMAFGVSALFLAAAGLYGVMSFAAHPAFVSLVVTIFIAVFSGAHLLRGSAR